MGFRSIAAKLGILASSLLLVAVLGEGVVRGLYGLGVLEAPSLIYPTIALESKTRLSANTTLAWELVPGSPLVNDDGFRDRDYAVARSPRSFRIVVLGDSVTFARGIADEDTFVTRLEERLNQREDGFDYEVLNLGVGGYNSKQEAEQYRVRGRKYAPDLIVVAYVLNDPKSALSSLETLAKVRKRPVGGAASPVDSAEALPAVLNRSKLAQLIVGRSRGLVRGPTPAPGFVQLYRRPKTWRVVAKGFAALAQMADEDGTPVLVVIVPAWVSFADYPYFGFHKRAANEAKRNGFDVLDLLRSSAFGNDDGLELQLAPGDVLHPSPAGHRHIARAIARHLEDRVLPR